MKINASESCSCGAAIEVEMLYHSDVRNTLEGFRKAHAECRRPASPSSPWTFPQITWTSSGISTDASLAKDLIQTIPRGE